MKLSKQTASAAGTGRLRRRAKPGGFLAGEFDAAAAACDIKGGLTKLIP